MNTRKFKLVLTRTEGIYVNTKTIDLNNFNSSAFASNPRDRKSTRLNSSHP